MRSIWQQLQPALRDAGMPATLMRSDIKRPVTRTMVKIDVTSANSGANCDVTERSVDAEIYVYPKGNNARDACLCAADAIRLALAGGIVVNHAYLPIEDGIDTDIEDGVLVALFRLDWMECIEEDGEPMETLQMDFKKERKNNK